MDIIEANECLRHWYGPPRKGTFDNTDVGVTEGEPTQMVSLKEVLKARVAAYKEAMEEAVKAAAEPATEAVAGPAANAVAEAPPGEPGGPGELVTIELDDDESESHDEGAYAAFEETIEVEDHEASYLESL
jgi:hypothetical protein